MIPDPELPPVFAPESATREADFDEPLCDLCGSECAPDDWIDTLSMTICPHCREDLVIEDASTFNARSEVGMVGASR